MGQSEIKVGKRKFILSIGHGESVRIVGALSDLEYVQLVQQLAVELRAAKQKEGDEVPELEWCRESNRTTIVVKSRYFYAIERRKDQADLLRHYVSMALQSMLHVKS